MKKNMSIDEVEKIDEEWLDDDIEQFIYDQNNIFNSVTLYLDGKGFRGHWITKEVAGDRSTDYEDHYAKGFRVCTRETDPSLAEKVMGPRREDSSPNEEIKYKEMILMKIPTKRYNAFLAKYQKDTQEQQQKADFSKHMRDRGGDFSTFTNSKRGKDAFFGN